MKKILSILLVLVLALATMSFAAAETDIIGTWRLTEAVSGDLNLDPLALGLDWLLVIYDDETCLFNANGDEVNIPWSVSGSKLTLHGLGAPIVVDIEDERLVIKQDSVQLIFTREEGAAEVEATAAEAGIPAGVRTNAGKADFVGTWRATHLETEGYSFTMEELDSELVITITDDTLTTVITENGVEDRAIDKIRFENGTCIVLGKDGKTDDITLYLLEDGTMALEENMDGDIVSFHFVRQTRTHIVARGENLSMIADKYGCSVQDIIDLNKDLLKNPSVIYAGWELLIP